VQQGIHNDAYISENYHSVTTDAEKSFRATSLGQVSRKHLMDLLAVNCTDTLKVTTVKNKKNKK